MTELYEYDTRKDETANLQLPLENNRSLCLRKQISRKRRAASDRKINIVRMVSSLDAMIATDACDLSRDARAR